ncbi:MAG: DNA methyltransferase [Candidatus Bathyarchaeia archaeon]
MDRLFFLVSGENPTLPFSEAKSILEAEGFAYQIIEELTQVLRLEADVNCVQVVKFRSAMTKVCGLEIFSCKADRYEIFENIEKMNIATLLGENESFAVRVMRVRGSASNIEAWTLEREIGELLFEKVKKAKVDLKSPEKTFIGILTDNRFVFGLKIVEIKHGNFIRRGPRRKAFFHPAAMSAKIARCMINLAQPKKEDIVMDPFCGTGSFLVEAGLIGCRIIGFDVKRYMVEGSQRNLRLFNIEPEGLAVADARFIPLANIKIKCVVTDPPYGTSATTLGFTTKDLIGFFFSEARKVLVKEGRVCVAAPKTIKVSGFGEKSGFEHLESHFIYVHRGLTREIAVFKLI